jgi:hypothetical protein
VGVFPVLSVGTADLVAVVPDLVTGADERFAGTVERAVIFF